MRPYHVLVMVVILICVGYLLMAYATMDRMYELHVESVAVHADDLQKINNNGTIYYVPK
jgi:predicted homoserine dehydrogenase-like protein